MPEIPLSVGSKLELLSSLPNFRILPRTLTHLSAYAVYNIYMIEAPRVLHFSVPSARMRRRVTVLVLSVCLFVCLSVCLLPLNRRHRSFLRSN